MALVEIDLPEPAALGTRWSAAVKALGQAGPALTVEQLGVVTGGHGDLEAGVAAARAFAPTVASHGPR